jgi:hypothetical protein
MSPEMTDKEMYDAAVKRVQEKKGFFIHLTIYIVINLLLVIIWFVTGSPFPWFIFPLAGWGIGLIFHALDVFVFSTHTDWEKRQIEKEMEKMKKGQK